MYSGLTEEIDHVRRAIESVADVCASSFVALFF